jgi:hypothetical protein
MFRGARQTTPAASPSVEDQLIAIVDDPASITGILLHGSRAAGTADSLSDFDVLCTVRPHCGQRREFIPFGGTYIDFYCSSPEVLQRRLNSFYPNNNNFLLNALTRGRILLDRSGHLTRLVQLAQRKREAGPSAMSEEDSVLMWQQIRSALGSVERSLARSRDSAAHVGLARIRCAEIFSKTVYAHCVEQRRWTASLPSVMEWAREHSPELHRACLLFLTAPSLEDSILALYELLRVVNHAASPRTLPARAL